MFRTRLLKSTPFRLALTFAVLFSGCYLLAGIATLEVVKQSLDMRLNRLIEEASSVITATYGSADITDLTDSVNSYAAAAPGKDRIFLLTSGGQDIAGNVFGAKFPLGWATVAGSTAGAKPKEHYRVFTRVVGPARLSVGMSFADTDMLQQAALVSFGWISVLALAFAIGGGALVGGRAQRRLDAITRTMNAIGRGDLGARAPVSRRADDIDQLSHQINGALDRLSSLVDGMRQVSSDIAHELKTPLNRLALTVETARDRAGRGEDVVEDLNEAEAECFRISETFGALLRIAQIEAGARKGRFTQIPLRPIVAAIGEAYSGVAEEQGQSFTYSVDARGGPLVVGDKDLLTQMIANLVENALRHTDQGSHIRLIAREVAKQVIVEIADDGPGVPEGEREKVFRRLYRLDKARSMPGSGLGLSLVKAIAELHGGTVNLLDNGPGLLVRVVLPVSSPATA